MIIVHPIRDDNGTSFGYGSIVFFVDINKNIPICKKYTHLQKWVYFIYPFEYTHYFEKNGYILKSKCIVFK